MIFLIAADDDYDDDYDDDEANTLPQTARDIE